jgi:hypothetical protein
MPSSISGRIEAILECKSQKTLWIIECPPQCIDRNENMMLQSSDITNMSNLLGSELNFLKNRILSEEFANGCWDVEFCDACQEDLEWYGWLCRLSLRGNCLFSWTSELRANSMRSFGPISWFSHDQLRMQQNLISFRIVWCHIYSQARLRFWVIGAFLFSVIREYPAFPELYRSIISIFILLSWFLIFSLDLCLILSRPF